jgi:hypothetical protein
MPYHRRDLMADFRAFYHLSHAEAMALPATEYLALASRTPAYQGVMAIRQAEAEEKERRSKPPRGTRLVDSDRESIRKDELLAAAISFS